MDTTKNMKSIIIGSGTYGQVYLAYLKEAGVEIVGFIDDNVNEHGKSYEGVPVLGDRSLLNTLKESMGVEAVYCPIGNNKVRVEFLELAQSLGYQTPNYIHPSVIISPNVKIGKGVYILMGSMIMPYTTVEDYTMISMNVCVAHHSILHKGSFLSTGVNFGASIEADEFAYCGISSTIMTGLHRLGKDCLIGAGAVVIKDVPDGAVMAGVPAKVIKYKPGYNPQNSSNTSWGGVNP